MGLRFRVRSKGFRVKDVGFKVEAWGESEGAKQQKLWLKTKPLYPVHRIMNQAGLSTPNS